VQFCAFHDILQSMRSKAYLRRNEAVTLTLQGLKETEIAERLHCSRRAVVDYLKSFHKSVECHYPLSLTPEDTQRMRSEALMHCQENQRVLILERERLQTAPAYTIEEKCKVSDSICRTVDTWTRAQVMLNSVHGLNAAVATNTINNNTQINIVEPSIMQRIQARRAEMAAIEVNES
jgi:predicted transcriptional regulator